MHDDLTINRMIFLCLVEKIIMKTGHKLRHKVYGVKVHGNWTAFYVYGGHLEGKRREERSST